MNIFENKTPMPPKDNSPDVVRTAMTMPEARANTTPVSYSSQRDDMAVVNVIRPRFGHGY